MAAPYWTTLHVSFFSPANAFEHAHTILTNAARDVDRDKSQDVITRLAAINVVERAANYLWKEHQG